MNRQAITGVFREQGCHAYQAKLAADFLDEGSPRHHLLVTPAGLGKVLIASQIAGFMVKQRQARRILVVAPSPFCMLWRSRLEGQSLPVPVQLMYGRDFREAPADPTKARTPWPESVIAVVPCDTATKPDIQDTLAASHWDLVILAEVQGHSRCQSVGLYQQMHSAQAIERSLLISDSPIELSTVSAQASLPEFHVTNWFDELADWDGQTIELPPVKWKVLEYTRSEPEVRFHRLVQEQLERSDSVHSPFRFQTELLLRRAVSSPYAAQQTLDIMGRKLNRTALGRLETNAEKEHGDPTEVEDVPQLSFNPEARQSYLSFVKEGFRAFQEIVTDAKLECLLGLLGELADSRPGRICVLCACADTVSYIHDALAEVGIPSVTINGGLRYTQRQEAMKEFVHGGGILLATPGALGEESDLNRVKHVIHYDLPANRSQVCTIEGRFGRINRSDSCRMYALEDISGVKSDPSAIPRLIGEPLEAV